MCSRHEATRSPKLPPMPFRSSLHAGADPSVPSGWSWGSWLCVGGAMDDAGCLELLPFSLLVDFDQQNAQYVSCGEHPKQDTILDDLLGEELFWKQDR